jgi:hypothetical protein
MSNFDGKHGEIANQSGVVIQTTHDIRDMVNRMRIDKDSKEHVVFPGAGKTLDTPTVRIDINDLVFRAGTSRAPRQNLLNNAIEVSSNLNGYSLNKNKVKGLLGPVDPSTGKHSEEDVLQAISESITFIGQALGATVPNPENEEDQKLQFTTRVQGTGHVMNTGEKKLVPGDTLYWDLFTKKELMSDDYRKRMTRFGYGARKVPLKTVPLSAAHNNFENAIHRSLLEPTKVSSNAVGKFGDGVAKALLYAYYLGLGAGNKKFTTPLDVWMSSAATKAAANKIATSNPDEYNEFVDGLLKSFLYLQDDLKRREIGKVLSYAEPGKGVDVLFGAN